jgi:hypothetical protein
MYKNKQKGFSLIVVFFVMSIMLVVVLSMISVLLGEMNTMRNIGDSTVAYYLAESGVEKTLYFDRQDPSGICNICTVCTEGDTFNNCNACTLTLGANIGEEENIDGCSVGSCVNCELSYNTSYVDSSGNKNYNIKAKITPSDIYSETAIFSSSIYNETAKTIETNFSKKILETAKPEIKTANVSPNSVIEGTQIFIIVEIVNIVNMQNSVAFIKKINDDGSYGEAIRTPLRNTSGNTYTGSWTGPLGAYVVEVKFCNTSGCTTQTI